MKRQSFAFGTAVLLLVACSQSNENHSSAPQKEEIQSAKGSSMAESSRKKAKDETSTFVSSSAAVESGSDSSRRFIRTANLKFKVKSVIDATYTIEETVRDHGGFVTFTEMRSNIDNVDSRAVSADSSMEITRYTITNTLTLRVPNKLLDTTLKDIAHNIDYLDYRVIKAEDVALSILEKQLTQRRAVKSEQRLANSFNGTNKNIDPTAAAELQNQQDEAADNAIIEALRLEDQIEFSTIELEIYQRQGVKREMIASTKEIEEYQPGIGSRFSDSLAFGWEIIVEFVLFLSKLWVFIVIGIATYIAYKRKLFSAKK